MLMESIERDVNGMTGKDRTGALIAMSGGVDSSVAAYLMRAEGYDCVGATMRLYRNEDIGLGQFHTCCSQRDIDDDRVCLTNLNRQLFATRRTVGQYKVDVAEQRIREIVPDAVVHGHKTFYGPQTAALFDFRRYDYVVDAIDTVTGKLELIEQAQRANVPIISSMGAGNKLDPTAFEVADIYETSVCPLARVMRRELRKRGVERLKVVYSREPPMTPLDDLSVSCRAHCICPPGTARKCTQRRQVPGSNAFVPAVVGLIVAGEVVKDLAMGEGTR